MKGNMTTAYMMAIFLCMATITAAYKLETKSVADISPANPTVSRSVFCGNNGEVCPGSAPICCGEAPYHYCAAAGSTCCGAAGRHSIATSCSQDEECCVGKNRATCCAAGSKCVVSPDGFPTCTRDSCGALATADECLAKENTGRCGWCCAERRCVELNTDNRTTSAKCNLPPLLSTDDRCPSLCHHATTCTRCLDRSTIRDESCSWCCATMSCMATSEYNACENGQHVSFQSECPQCMYMGHGVNERVPQGSSFFMLLSSSLLLAGVICTLACLRMVLAACLERQNSRSAEEIQETVRRYGFRLTDTASVPINHASAGTDACYTCALCHRVLRLYNLESHFTGRHATAHSPRRQDAVSEDAAAAVEETAPQPEEDDLIAIMLPCSHNVCYACFGIPQTQATTTTPADEGQSSPVTAVKMDTAAEDAAAAAQSPTSKAKVVSENVELIKKFCKGKCPVCKKKIEEALVTEKVLSI